MKLSVRFVKMYQFIWRPIKQGFADQGIILNQCYFTPSCSDYAILVLEKYSFRKAFPMIVNRLYRCHKKIGDKIDYPT